jgi:hypothetical protein
MSGLVGGIGSKSAIAGAISAGKHSLGWQHIQTFHHTPSSTATGEIFFNDVFSDDYISFCLQIGYWNVAENPFDINFRFTSGGNSPTGHNDAYYYSYHSEKSHGESSYQNTRQNGDSYGRIVNNCEGNDHFQGICGGEIYFYSVTNPTVLGTAANRGGNLRPFARGYLNHYHNNSSGTNAGYGSTQFDIRFNGDHSASDYTGLQFWCVNAGNTGGENLFAHTHLALFGLKAQH